MLVTCKKNNLSIINKIIINIHKNSYYLKYYYVIPSDYKVTHTKEVHNNQTSMFLYIIYHSTNFKLQITNYKL